MNKLCKFGLKYALPVAAAVTVGNCIAGPIYNVMGKVSSRVGRELIAATYIVATYGTAFTLSNAIGYSIPSMEQDRHAVELNLDEFDDERCKTNHEAMDYEKGE